MTPVGALILLLEDFQALKLTGFIGALGGSVFWAWRKGRRYGGLEDVEREAPSGTT